MPLLWALLDSGGVGSRAIFCLWYIVGMCWGLYQGPLVGFVDI